ncbi:transporter substrate-binding domain-containing protein [Colwellia sp. TT2012]|uniref:transporter substrate-binding domain-containing protein n=1 Tax=Colwellia sp. TT2012 TaxID=1720342 RepID=UPI000709021E|nr:transporter substrate-binding domain-containing protein [Colwellia sp. TT2012]
MVYLKIVFLLLLYLLICPAIQAESSYTVKLGTKVAWPPYHLDLKSGAAGIAVEALDCVMARIKQPYEINKLPWSRAQALTKSGALDGFFSASQSDKRDRYAELSSVFIPQIRKFYFLKKYFPAQLQLYSIDYIKVNFTVGARFSSNAMNYLKINNYNIGAEHLSETVLMRMLDAGRMDAVLENSLVFALMVKNKNRSMDEYLSVEVGKKNMGVYFSKKFLDLHPNFLTLFNANIPPCSLIK